MDQRAHLPAAPIVHNDLSATSTPHNDSSLTADYVVRETKEQTIHIPGYQILSELGRGGMGVVYLALHRELNRRVALKMLLHADAAGSSATARFLTESEVLATLQHPNIVQVFDRGDHNGIPFFAMEYCPGGSLSDRVKDSPLNTQEAPQIVERLARAVSVAHERSILHRDLKPGNVIYSADGTPKITDFGLAKRLDTIED